MTANPTNMPADEFISYLNKHGITDYKQRGDEISFPCPFHECDDDHRGNEEYHCGFNLETCTYHCFKCDENGNFVTLRKFFGDYEQSKAKQKTPKKKGPSFKSAVNKAFEATSKSEEVCNYFNSRGINNKSIETFKLGMWNYHGHKRLMIPVFDKYGEVAYLKLRKTPEDEGVEKAMGVEDSLPKYLVYPSNSELILFGEEQLRKSNSSDVLICEGELDAIIATQEGVKMPVVTPGGALVFKEEWTESFINMRNIYLCFDADETGEKGFKKVANYISEKIPTASIFKVTLPFDNDSHMDLTDYFTKKIGTAEELFTKYSKFYCGVEPIDVNKFKEMSVDDVANILDMTIKDNYANKVIIFLAMLLAYTEDLQLNIIMNAESASGKTYLVNEVSNLFPKQDVLPYGNTSPTAPYYNEDYKRIDEETGEEYSDLERKILIFEDQPNPLLLANLRSFLSHDSKKTPFMLTNKGKGGKNTANDSYILGFSSVFFCSANLRIDEQELTRSFVLSPENTEKAIRASIDAAIDRGYDEQAYVDWIASNDDRNCLKDRILYIKSLEIKYISLKDKEYVKECFYKNLPILTTGARRKIKQFMSLIKGIALLNAPFRMDSNGKIIATKKDVDEAMKLWNTISESMSYGLAPQILDFYKSYILQAYLLSVEVGGSKDGITTEQLATYYFDITKHSPNFDMIKDVYIPALVRAKMISYQKDEKKDKRFKLIKPLVFFDNDDDLDKTEKM